jgi:hypothetical protein
MKSEGPVGAMQLYHHAYEADLAAVREWTYAAQLSVTDDGKVRLDISVLLDGERAVRETAAYVIDPVRLVKLIKKRGTPAA